MKAQSEQEIKKWGRQFDFRNSLMKMVSIQL